jgi:hypothetical protein
MNEPTNLTLFSFNKRLMQFRKGCQDAMTTMEQINENLRKNVEAQKILNKHLADRNAAMKPDIKPFKLELVK